MVRLLLEAGASPDVKIINGEPVVVTAARRSSSIGVLELLLDHDADTDAVNHEGSCALMVAAGCGPLQAVKMLVARGVNLDCRDNAGNTPLLVSIVNGRRLVAEYLVGLEGVDFRSANLAGHVPWYQSVWMGYDAVLKCLRDRGVSDGVHVEVAGSS